MIDDLLTAIRAEKADLHRTAYMPRGPEAYATLKPAAGPRPSFSTAQVEAMLRVEVVSRLIVEVMNYLYEQYGPIGLGKDGPIMLEGVAVYMVDRLPPSAPGWRVVNPMKVRER